MFDRATNVDIRVRNFSVLDKSFTYRLKVSEQEHDGGESTEFRDVRLTLSDQTFQHSNAGRSVS